MNLAEEAAKVAVERIQSLTEQYDLDSQSTEKGTTSYNGYLDDVKILRVKGGLLSNNLEQIRLD